jgi:hypothetical protein
MLKPKTNQGLNTREMKQVKGGSAIAVGCYKCRRESEAACNKCTGKNPPQPLR